MTDCQYNCISLHAAPKGGGIPKDPVSPETSVLLGCFSFTVRAIRPIREGRAQKSRFRGMEAGYGDYTVGYSPSQRTLRNFIGSVLPSVENSSTWLNRSRPR